MKPGDLVKIFCVDGAVSHEVGIYMGKLDSGSVFSPLVEVFLINGEITNRSRIAYHFTVMEG